MGKRIYGFDFGRGLAILGVVFAHSFMGQVTGWNTNILFDLAKKTPIVLLILLFVPVVALTLMGALFSFITAVCVTMSSIKITAKGGNLIWRYIFMKMVFALVLRFLEDFWGPFLKDVNIFKDHKFSFPTTSLEYSADTLDDVGFFSWFIPLLVYLFTKIPRLNYRHHMAIFTVLGVVLFQFNDVTIEYCRKLGEWFEKNEFYLFYYFTTKLDNGAFAILQYLSFGMFGGAFGLLFSHTNDYKHYWTYWAILSGICLVFGLSNLTVEYETFITRAFEWIKPKSFLFLMVCIQSAVMLFFMHLTDNPKRPLEKRYNTVRRTTFLRRINILSLTAYIVEPRFSRTVLMFFKLLFGEGSDREKETCLWSWHVVLLYMLLCTTLWAFVCLLWEKAHFRFSMEHQLSCIMSWLFQQPYNRMDYKSAIYGPVEDLKKEMEANKAKETAEMAVVVKDSA